MQNEDYKIRLEKLIEAVSRMRHNQKIYDRFFASQDKPAKKASEKKVDELLKDGIAIITSTQIEIV